MKFATKSIKRKFNGKVYTNVASKPTKREATARAEAWREEGFSARIVKLKNGYDIYIRK
jgi:hypothetical protein